MRLFLCSVLIACTATIIAADDKPAVQLDSAAVSELVQQLASGDFATRERATQELSKLDEAPEALRQATKSNDLEVRRRAQSAIDSITTRAENKASSVLVKWAHTKEFSSNNPHDPIVVQDKVIVGTDQGELRAYRCQDGNSIWIHQHGERIFRRPCSDGERIYFSSARGLTTVRVSDGTEVWNFGVSGRNGPTFVLPELGMVFVAGPDGNLYALDAETGKQIWASDFVADAPPDPPNFRGERARSTAMKANPSALASDGKTLFLSVFDQCRIVAVNATDGKRLWSFQSRGWVYGTAIATEKHVFFGSQDGHFYCLDKHSGTKVWSYKTKGRIESGGAVDDKYVYFGSCDGKVYCLNQADGKERWRFATDLKDGHNSAIYSVPILHQGGVFFAAGEGQAYAVHQESGELKWKVRPSTGSEIYSSPATDGTFCFLVTRADLKESGEASLVALWMK